MQRPHHLLRLFRALAFVLACGLTSTVQAVVISAQSDQTNTTAPGNDPGWANVTHLGNATGVYLGNRWMITAGHVSDAAVRFTDGRDPFEVSFGSKVSIRNPNGSIADLRMFRLAEDPNLPALQIADSSPDAGTIVTMIGSGFDKALALHGWTVDSQGVWSEPRLPSAKVVGYSLLQTSRMRWGVNQVLSGTPTFFPGVKTFGFSTRFDRPGIPFEAQAVVGDSGGGVFEVVDGGWKLVGIIDTVQELANQPDWTVVYGTTTNSADLSIYRDQILDLVNRPEPFWQNQVNHFDVDGSGRVNARDALLIISELETGLLGSDLSGPRASAKPFFDVTGDRFLNSQDALQLISALLGQKANPTASALSSGFFVPEPSSAMLSAAALVCFALAMPNIARRKRRVSQAPGA
jgi:hypothetical protein